MLERLHLELTNICNFCCEFCPDGVMERRRGQMQLALLTRILDELASTPLTRILAFHLMGEPFIYPQIMTAIDLALARRLKLHLTTNGSTFALRPQHIPQLLQRPVPKLTISLQTPDPISFQIRGAPANLSPEQYFCGIRNLILAHQASPSPTRIHLKFLDTTPHPFLVPQKPLSIADNRRAMEHHLRHWIQQLCPQMADPEQIIARYRPGRWQRLHLNPRLVLEIFPLDNWGNQRYPARWGYCNGASRQAGILYDGTVVPCCKDYEGHIPLGSLSTHTLAEILAAAPACALRRDFSRWRVSHPVCQRCLGADTPPKTFRRQLGSLAYFHLYRPWQRLWDPEWGEV